MAGWNRPLVGVILFAMVGCAGRTSGMNRMAPGLVTGAGGRSKGVARVALPSDCHSGPPSLARARFPVYSAGNFRRPQLFAKHYLAMDRDRPISPNSPPSTFTCPLSGPAHGPISSGTGFGGHFVGPVGSTNFEGPGQNAQAAGTLDRASGGYGHARCPNGLCSICSIRRLATTLIQGLSG